MLPITNQNFSYVFFYFYNICLFSYKVSAVPLLFIFCLRRIKGILLCVFNFTHLSYAKLSAFYVPAQICWTVYKIGKNCFLRNHVLCWGRKVKEYNIVGQMVINAVEKNKPGVYRWERVSMGAHTCVHWGRAVVSVVREAFLKRWW